MVLTEIISSIAGLLGFDLGDYDYFGSLNEDAWDFDEGLKSAGTSAKKLKQGLRGFDKLNVITTPSAGSTGSGGGASGGISPKLLEAFNKTFDNYNKKLKDVQMKATRIRDKIMEWLGFTKLVDEETGDVSFKFDHITGGTVLGALVLGGSIYKGISGMFKILKKIGFLKFPILSSLVNVFKNGTISSNIATFGSAFESLATSLGMSVGTLGLVVAAIVAIAGALVYAYNTNETFREKVNEAWENIKEIFEVLYEVVSNTFTTIWGVIEPIWKAIKTLLVGVVKYCYENIVKFFSLILDAFNGLSSFVLKLVQGDFSGAFDELVNMVKNLFNDWKTYFNNIKEIFGNLASDLWKVIKELVPKAISKLGEILTWIKELPNKFFYWAGQAVGTLWKKIEETNWKDLGKKILDGIISGISDIATSLKNFGTNLYNKIKEKINSINWKDLGKKILDGIINGMFNYKDKLKNWGSSFVKGIKDALGIHSPAKVIIDAKIGNYVFDGITEGMEKELPTLKIQAENISDTLNKEVKKIKPISFDYLKNITTNVPNDNYLKNNDLFYENINSNANNKELSKPINATFVIQVGDKEIARQVINNLQDMAKNNGKPITIGG